MDSELTDKALQYALDRILEATTDERVHDILVDFCDEIAATLTDDRWKLRCEQLEVVAAALYLGRDDGRELFDMYRSVYLPEPAKEQ